MIHKALSDLTAADVLQLIESQTPEGPTLDYKEAVDLQGDESKREFSRDLVSFAPTGGDLLYGLREARDDDNKLLGYPALVVGIGGNFEQLRQQMENVARDWIAPRLRLDIREISGFENGSVAIVRVRQSWSAPHMVEPRRSQFFSRNSAGRHPMDVHQLREAFRASETAFEVVRAFRDRRAKLLFTAALPIPNDGLDRARLLVHVVPLAVGTRTSFDVQEVERSRKFVPIEYGNGFNHRYNLDGFMVHCGGEAYSLAFRNGATEGSCRVLVGEPQQLNPLEIEQLVLDFVRMSIEILRHQEIEAPLVVMLALRGLAGVEFVFGVHAPRLAELKKRVDRSELVLPEILVEDLDSRRIPHQLRPLFDSLWQCGGWAKSPGYNEEGEWREDVHQ